MARKRTDDLVFAPVDLMAKLKANYLNLTELSKISRYSSRTLQKMYRNGDIEGIKIGREVRVRHEEVIRLTTTGKWGKEG